MLTIPAHISLLRHQCQYNYLILTEISNFIRIDLCGFFLYFIIKLLYFFYRYEIGDGTHVSEEGYIKNPNTDNEIVVKKGFYSYKGADNKIYTVTYYADETGYHASGEHLPKSPPVPAAIQA